MRSSPVFRVFSALLGALFVFNFAQPPGMSGMDMRGMNMTGAPSAPDAAAGAHRAMHDVASIPDGSDLAAHCEAMDTAERGEVLPAHPSTEQHSSAPSDGQGDCTQHECCGAALVHASLAPVATLAWLPEQVISQDTPDTHDCVPDTEAQLLLPFANGPPSTVIV